MMFSDRIRYSADILYHEIARVNEGNRVRVVEVRKVMNNLRNIETAFKELEQALPDVFGQFEDRT